MPCVAFGDWVLSLNIIALRSIQVVAGISRLFPLGLRNTPLCGCTIVERYLACFCRFLVIRNKTAIRICVQVFELYGKCMFNFIRSCQTS